MERFVGQLFLLAAYITAVAPADIAVAPVVYSQKFVGDVCTLDKGGAGVCRISSDCPDVRAALARGEAPTVCTTEGNTVFVCCPSDRVSTRKCEEYGEAVYRYENSFDMPPQKIRVNQCATKGVPFIIGGVKARANEFPHMALLGFGDNTKDLSWRQGGSLISERFVLTAAHNFFFEELGSYIQDYPKMVRLGELNRGTIKESNKHEDFIVAEAIPHPNYHAATNIEDYYDVGLLRLSRDVTFTASIRPACLNSIKEIEGKEAIATGWGYTSTDPASQETSDHLMKLKVPILKFEVCYAFYYARDGFRQVDEEESMVCAGYFNRGKDTCQGDSGGPLQIKLNKPYCMYSIVGITSTGALTCGNSPSIYTRVSFYLPWIESIVWPNN